MSSAEHDTDAQQSTPTANAALRLAARLIDGLVLLIPMALAIIVLGGSSLRLNYGIGRQWIGLLVATGVALIYFTQNEAAYGATVGKRALKLQVVDLDGENPTLANAARRNLWLSVVLVPYLGGFLLLIAGVLVTISISFDPYHRGSHDYAAEGTAVLRTHG